MKWCVAFAGILSVNGDLVPTGNVEETTTFEKKLCENCKICKKQYLKMALNQKSIFKIAGSAPEGDVICPAHTDVERGLTTKLSLLEGFLYRMNKTYLVLCTGHTSGEISLEIQWKRWVTGKAPRDMSESGIIIIWKI
ncbi:hypothetical protein CBL_07001 [Carabus blaptoides fortunei]